MLAMRAMQWVVALTVLGPIVAYDYRQRTAGLRPDRWHWADKILIRWDTFPFYLYLV